MTEIYDEMIEKIICKNNRKIKRRLIYIDKEIL
jgi:hypothetical protein